jgi:hypothetical protein
MLSLSRISDEVAPADAIACENAHNDDAVMMDFVVKRSFTPTAAGSFQMK